MPTEPARQPARHRTGSRRVLATLVAAVALLATACGSSTDPLASNSPTSQPTTQPTTSSPGSSTSANEQTTGSSDQQPSGTSSGTGPSESGTSSTQAAGGPIVIGSGDFDESVILGEIYAAALTAKGIDATTKPRIGNREAYYTGMLDGSINLIPEYTGGLLFYLQPDTTATDPDQVYKDLQAALPDTLKVLDYAAAEDKDSLTVTKATADQFSLKSIGDLKDHAKDMVLGGPAEWETRPTGVPGFAKNYDVTFKKFEVTPLGPQMLTALDSGLIQAGNVLTTDPAFNSGKYVALEDPVHMFGAQNVVPLIAASVATSQVTDVLDAVSAALTTADLVALNDQVTNQHQDAAAAAKAWVAAKGLG